MSKRYVTIIELAENDPYIENLEELKEDIEDQLYSPGRVVSIKPTPERKPVFYGKEDELKENRGFNKCLDKISGEIE